MNDKNEKKRRVVVVVEQRTSVVEVEVTEAEYRQLCALDGEDPSPELAAKLQGTRPVFDDADSDTWHVETQDGEHENETGRPLWGRF